MIFGKRAAGTRDFCGTGESKLTGVTKRTNVEKGVAGCRPSVHL